jgi:hypothetical protein
MRVLDALLVTFWLTGARSDGNIPRQSDDPSNDEITCIDVSFSQPEWYLYSSRYSQTSTQNGTKLGTVGFNAQNLATGTSFDCIAKNVSLAATGAGQSWHNCDNPRAQFKFDLVGDLISMRETWNCGKSSTL